MALASFIFSRSGLLQQRSFAFDVFDPCISNRHFQETRICSSKRQQNLPTNRLYHCRSESDAPRVFVVSDLHTDYPENMAWVKRLSPVLYKKDVLIVAGDVAETYKNFVSTMSELKDRFNGVFYVPGNHDLWCRREEGNYLLMNSLEKLTALLDACSGLGVETEPAVLDGLGIIPLYSWYHKSFDKEKDVTAVQIPSLEMVAPLISSIFLITSVIFGRLSGSKAVHSSAISVSLSISPWPSFSDTISKSKISVDHSSLTADLTHCDRSSSSLLGTLPVTTSKSIRPKQKTSALLVNLLPCENSGVFPTSSLSICGRRGWNP